MTVVLNLYAGKAAWWKFWMPKHIRIPIVVGKEFVIGKTAYVVRTLETDYESIIVTFERMFKD